MAIGDDLTPFFRTQSDGGFAATAMITPNSGATAFEIPVIFDRYGIEGNPYAGQVLSDHRKQISRSAMAKTADADLVKQGDLCVIDSVRYEVAGKSVYSINITKLVLEPAKF